MPILPLPYIGQWGIGANLRNGDCGPACVAMLLEYYHKRGNLTVDNLALETTLKTADVGLPPSALVDLAARHGLNLKVHNLTTLADIRAEIDKGRPVIALIAYRFILNRLDQRDAVPGSDGHFIVVVGYDDTHFVANDPDYWVPYTQAGHDTLINITQLDEAIAGEGYGQQCVFVAEDDMATTNEINQLKAAIASVTLSVQALTNYVNGLIPNDTVTTPPPPPPAPTTMYVLADQTHVRATPSTTASIVATLTKNTSVSVVQTVLGTDEHGQGSSSPWWKTTDGTYIYGPLLSVTHPS